MQQYCAQHGAEPWEVISKIADGHITIPYTAQLLKRYDEISEIIEDLEGLDELREVIDYLFPDDELTFSEIRKLSLQILDEIVEQDRIRFLSKLTSAIAKPEIPTEIEDVRIMSLHKSKGLSAPITIIVGCVEGLLPRQPDSSLPELIQDAQLEEQRRLFYVGISRVKSSPADNKPGTLVLTYSQRMPLADAMGAGIYPASVSHGVARLNASRFVGELGPEAPQPVAG